MIKQYEIYDNFLDDPSLVIASAKMQTYYTQGKNEVTKNIKNDIPVEEDQSINPHHGDPRYFSPGWRGYRSKLLNDKDPYVHNMVMDKLIANMFGDFYPSEINYSVYSFFHILTEEFQQAQSWFHIDNGNFLAGVYYLAQNPPPNSGTVLELKNGKMSLENKFNRLVIYNPNIMHSVENCFGDSIDNARLTLVFFMQKLSIDSNEGKER